MDVENNSWILGGDNLFVKEAGQQTTAAPTTEPTQSTSRSTTETTQPTTQTTKDDQCEDGQLFNECGRPCDDSCNDPYPCNFEGFDLATGISELLTKTKLIY